MSHSHEAEGPGNIPRALVSEEPGTVFQRHLCHPYGEVLAQLYVQSEEFDLGSLTA